MYAQTLSFFVCLETFYLDSAPTQPSRLSFERSGCFLVINSTLRQMMKIIEAGSVRNFTFNAYLGSFGAVSFYFKVTFA